MSPFRVALLLLLVGCARGVPLDVRDCTIAADGQTESLRATLINRADRPMLDAVLRVDVYQNYRYMRAGVPVVFRPVLDPGTSRALHLPVDLPGAASGAATCIAIAADY